MQQKPSDEFNGLQRHGTLPILPLIVFPPERDLAVVTRQQPPIGDGDAMGVAGEVAEHVLRPGQWGLGVDHPIHIKLSTPRKLLWHYRVATPTIMPASKELPYDDHTTGGPCHA
jgi:hypothetical protein